MSPEVYSNAYFSEFSEATCTKFGENIEQTSGLPKNALNFRHIASFCKKSASGAAVVEDKSQISDFFTSSKLSKTSE